MTTELTAGFPPNHLVAPADHRYINKYYWDATRSEWLLIVDCKQEHNINTWIVRCVRQEDGCPIGHLERFTTDLWADRFSDRPFNVDYPTKEEDWFKNLLFARMLHNKSSPATMSNENYYKMYLERRKQVNSYEALVRVGLRDPQK